MGISSISLLPSSRLHAGYAATLASGVRITAVSPIAVLPVMPLAEAPSDALQSGETFPRATHMAAPVEASVLTYGAHGLINVQERHMQVWEQAYDNPISRLMERNSAATSNHARLAGLGAALLEQVSTHPVGYRQTVAVADVGAPDVPSAIQEKAHDALVSFQSAPSQKVELSIQTKSGAMVRLTIVDQSEQRSSGTGISVEVFVDGELGPAQREALLSLSQGFERAIQGLAADEASVDLEGLMQFDSAVIAKIALTSHRYGRDAYGGRVLKLGASFAADANAREVKLKRPEGEVAMQIDLRKPATWGNSEKKANAVRQYLERFDHAAVRGKADRGLAALFRSTFTALHTSDAPPGVSAEHAASRSGKSVDLQRDAAAWSEEDTSWLTGLADFDATLQATPQASNPFRPTELDTFTYALRQSTSITGTSRGDRAMIQAQSAQLSATYHQSLTTSAPPMLDSTRASQNYYFKHIEDSSNSEVDLAYDKGHLIAATMTKVFSQSTRVLKYEFGRLLEETTTPLQQSGQLDLLPLIRRLQEQVQAKEMTDGAKQQVLKGWNALALEDLQA